VIIDTDQGKIRGEVHDGVARFLGVPYAAAPFGDQRFELPRPHDGWDDVLEACSYGPSAPQHPYPDELKSLLANRIIPGTEILNLNVSAPAAPAPDAAGYPVMVWIHGGGLTRGSNSVETYDGRAFARDGVILVSVNYRLGAEGFSVLDDAPANLGLADLVMALRWVRANIGGFGGDPDRVTVFGQSAGGACVAALGASPEAVGLFAAAIIQSGPISVTPRSHAQRATRLVARELGVPTTREAFQRVSPAELLRAQARVTAKSSILGGPAFGLVVDDVLLPCDPALALASPERDFPLMMGYTTEEYRLWFLPTGAINRINRAHLLAARLKLKTPRKAVRVYSRNRPHARPGEILGMLATDGLLRVPKNNLADARTGATWMYEFAWSSPVQDLGAAHAVELPFVFDSIGRAESDALTGPGAPQRLADAMHAAWVRFARSGDPGWDAWDDSRPVMTFDDPLCEVVHAPRDDERTALVGSRR
jgi:para-nitrobenzyl esterase